VSDLYPLGQPVRLSTAVVDITGAAADPTALTLTVTPAGGASTVLHWPTPAELVHDSTGAFHYDYTPAAAGHYVTYWTATGTAAGVSPYSTVFDVFNPASYPRLVSFADAKSFLRLTGTADDQLLDRMLGWASARILMEVVAYATTYTQRVLARHGRLTLSRTPVRAITAVVAVNSGGIVVSAADLIVLNPAHGLVVADAGACPRGLYDVTYTAGTDETPAGVDGACLQLLQHWWNQSQAHGSATYGDGGFVPDFDGLPFAVRNKLAVAAPPVLMA
jgi:uncharacterized phiE125 gp8 family phage protein